MDAKRTPSYGIILAFLLLGIASRLAPHPWNATPLMAIALFGGTYLSRRWAILLPWAAIALSDLVLGWHRTIPFTWGAVLLTGFLAWWLRARPSTGRIVTASLAGSCLFFVVTNFGVWMVGGLYPQTLEGLRQCYVAAIPFFRNSIAGDLVYTAALFGGYAVWRRCTSFSWGCRPASPS